MSLIQPGNRALTRMGRALQFLAEALAHAGLAMFGGIIGDGGGRQLGVGDAGDRDNVENVSGAGFFEQRNEAAGEQQRAGDNAGDGLADRQGIIVVEFAGQPLGGVVDEDVEWRSLVAHLLGVEGDGADVGHVEGHGFGALAGAEPDRFGEGREILDVAAGEDEVCALVGKTNGQGRAEAAAGAGDENAFSLEGHARINSERVCRVNLLANIAMIKAAINREAEGQRQTGQSGGETDERRAGEKPE